MNYLAKLQKNRELKVKVGRWMFIARRPTDMEMQKIVASDGSWATLARDYVNGWDGVIENDVIGGGGQDAVPFSQETWKGTGSDGWCADHPNVWQPIAEAVLESYKSHRAEVEDSGKNSAPG